MFENVSQYTDFVVGVVRRYEGRIAGRRLLDIVEWSAASFDRYRSGGCVGVGERQQDQGVLGLSSGKATRQGESVGEFVGRIVGESVERANSVVSSESGRHGDIGVVGGKGPNYERNRLSRERRKAARDKAAKIVKVVPTEVSATWVARKNAENKAAEERALRQLAKMKREAVDGTDEKKYKAEVALLDGQLSGKYSLAAPKHVIGYAKTLISATSGSNSTGAAKTVWSGSGASKKSRLTEVTTSSGAKVYRTQLEATLEEEVKKLKIQNAKLKLQIPEPKGYQGDWY